MFSRFLTEPIGTLYAGKPSVSLGDNGLLLRPNRSQRTPNATIWKPPTSTYSLVNILIPSGWHTFHSSCEALDGLSTIDCRNICRL